MLTLERVGVGYICALGARQVVISFSDILI